MTEGDQRGEKKVISTPLPHDQESSQSSLEPVLACKSGLQAGEPKHCISNNIITVPVMQASFVGAVGVCEKLQVYPVMQLWHLVTDDVWIPTLCLMLKRRGKICRCVHVNTFSIEKVSQTERALQTFKK